MNKKHYIQPTYKVIIVGERDIICTSPDIPDYDGPLGAKGSLEDNSLDTDMFGDDSSFWCE